MDILVPGTGAANATLVWLRRCALGLVLVAACLGMAVTGLAIESNEQSLEYAVKGAFLYKFGAFAEWPPAAFAAPDAPLVIGIIGDDPFGAKLDQIVYGRTIDGRPIVVWRAQSIEKAQGAHILFISQSERNRLESILSSLQGKHVLTVADFEYPSATINFVIDSNKVRFNVNLDQAERNGVKLSSKLLSVAKDVQGR